MKTSFEKITGKELSLNELLSQAKEENAIKASNDNQKTLLLAIDMQNDFMDNGELGVPGALQDSLHSSKFLYEHFEHITKVAVSLDHHQPNQIFHPMWWVDENGNHPVPFTLITAEEVKTGKWKAVNYQLESLEYVENLEKCGKKQLCIWTYHCLEGTDGAALEHGFSNMIHFHSVARNTDILRLPKGRDPFSEMYGIVKPEFDQKNYVNETLLSTLDHFDRIIIVGEAKSHCVLESLRQILEHKPEKAKDIIVLEDCMSSIPGFENETEKTFLELKEQYGFTITTSKEYIK